MMAGKVVKRLGIPSVALLLMASVAPAHAESYSNLQSSGYKTSKLTRGASGSLGWYVSNGEKKFFCRMRATNAYVGKTGMVGFTSSGKQLSLDRKVYEQYAGGFDPSMPQLADLKAGRLNARSVGYCVPAK
ncbi:hypothetical protein [Mesorhizobium sp. M2E.F.Ca.ET.209.01.1.1]|uniref:hypothetical protein n=1 Tax=Mesorhizobium sp. M2E.F.Ca.ET.209.01.1.1 TaxID=2500526 RepID=UPI001FEEC514|nr:hypothetical protein [Mesorhizobium sp. M2E.F.Ca.ET.209.01.1.1]